MFYVKKTCNVIHKAGHLKENPCSIHARVFQLVILGLLARSIGSTWRFVCMVALVLQELWKAQSSREAQTAGLHFRKKNLQLE